MALGPAAPAGVPVAVAFEDVVACTTAAEENFVIDGLSEEVRLDGCGFVVGIIA